MIYSAPRSGRETTPHWQAARHGRLLIPYCSVCASFRWPATGACLACGAAFEWKEFTGAGKVFTFSIVRRPVQPGWKDAAPYIVAFVELAEGVRLLGNIVDCKPDQISCGMFVRCRFVETTDPDLGLPVFAPA